MRSFRIFLPILVLVSLAAFSLTAQDKSKKAKGKKEPAIRALLITGGCCHDYDTQKTILMTGIGERANVKWSYVHEQFDGKDHEINIYQDPNWAEGFDVVVHNECYGGVTNDDFVENITEGHVKAGAAALFIHCSMHSYRAATTDEYRKLIGVSSFNHGKHHPIDVTKLASHPVINPVPDDWTTVEGELYNTNPKTHPDAKVWESATALAEGKTPLTEEPQVCIWVNEYRGIRTFGTTIGHHNVTMMDPVYLDLVTRGLLWSVGKFGEEMK